LNDFTDLYNEYAGPVRRFLLSLTHNEESAEELTQETLYRAFLQIDRFRAESSIYSWLCQIAKNLYLNERKKLSRRRPSTTAYLLEGVNGEEWTQKLLLREQAMLVHQVLHSLPEPYKEVFTLKVFGELKFKDIANLFGKTESWAKMTFYRAKERIVKGMEEKS
jgi:RNA polymerase sigma factor, sigma-70 family